MYALFWLDNLKAICDFKDQGVNGKITLRYTWQKQRCVGVWCVHFVQNVLCCCKYGTDVLTVTQAKYCLYELLSASRTHCCTELPLKTVKRRSLDWMCVGGWSVLLTLIWNINRYGNGPTASHLRGHRLTTVASFWAHTRSVIKSVKLIKKHKNSIPVAVYSIFTQQTHHNWN